MKNLIYLPTALLMLVLAVVLHVVSGQNSQTDIPDFKDSDKNVLLSWEAPKELQKDYAYYLSGFDEDNSPIWVAELGLWDVRKSSEMGPEREKNFKKYIQQFLARCQDSTKLRSTSNNPVTEFNIIVDMAGYSIRQPGTPASLALTLWMARQFEQAFRESMKAGYIVNGNYVFTTVYNLMKPILGANIYKIDVFGTNSDKYIPRLLSVFPKDQLPSWYGGNQQKPIQIYG